MKTCKNCNKPIHWNEDLQRYEHLDTQYDGCGPRKGASFFDRDAGNRAEPTQ